MHTFLIVDDHALFRSGLNHLLQEAFEGCEVHEGASVEDGLAVLHRVRVDLVLLEVNLGGRSGFDLIRASATQWPTTPVLVVSMYSDEQYAALAVQRGASGYVSKTCTADEMLENIRRAVSGRVPGARVTNEQRSPHVTLSPREQELMQLLIAGHSVGAAASRMAISAKTVSTHRAHLFQKLGVRNTIELALYAVREGLLTS